MDIKYAFDPKKHENQLVSIIQDVAKLKNPIEARVQQIFRKYPKNDSGLYRKSEVIQGVSHFLENGVLKITREQANELIATLRAKDTRTISGVTPVTVLTKPFPCPGKCIFCPNDVRMPKSYLSDEPGAQRATRNRFDPYAQTFNRLLAYKAIGHPTDKIELIILGGTWTSYPETYQIWFVKRCFDAMNDFHQALANKDVELPRDQPFAEDKLEEVDGDNIQKTYNQIVSLALLPKREDAKHEHSTWDELFTAQKENETAETRCIGLVIETRPDEINEEEVIRIRKLGATKTQIGFQSLNDKVLDMNKRGHDVDTTRLAVAILRKAGFKIHAHWMPNLYGSNPDVDIKDYKKMFSDPGFKPDEIKIYPCSLIASAELMHYYKKGLWKPYTRDELVEVLSEAYKLTPAYCRITRMIRDIGSQDIVTGNKKTNLREDVELKVAGSKINEIRYREIRNEKVSKKDLKMDIVKYDTDVSTEYFLQYVTEQNKIAGFLRLSIPKDKKNFQKELEDASIIREVHVYGPSIEIGEKEVGKPQHLGLGKALIEKAEEISRDLGFRKIAVISSIGTRNYYLKHGFKLEDLYQTKTLS